MGEMRVGMDERRVDSAVDRAIVHRRSRAMSLEHQVLVHVAAAKQAKLSLYGTKFA
jgi:hypothetical protein